MKQLCLAILFARARASAANTAECTVNDPSGTPLNVRSRPYGSTRLHNGAKVFIEDLTLDRRGTRLFLSAKANQDGCSWITCCVRAKALDTIDPR
jgi:hypothetical protein